MRILKLRRYYDPGHSWVKIKRDLLNKLSISDKISSYSYVRGDYVYLEEDCDLATLWDALEAKNIKPVFINYFGNRQSRIRNYNSYNV
jgi:hypothetical protein